MERDLWTEAEEACARAVQAASEDYRAWVALGDSHSSRGEWEEAIRCYQQANELDPSATSPYVQLGLSYRLSDPPHWAESEVMYLQALAIQPSLYNGLVQLGDLYVDMGHSGQAVPLYERAIDLYPTYPQAYVQLSYLYQRQSDTERARRVIEQALETSPRSPAVHKLMADFYVQEGELTDAAREYRAAIALSSRYFHAYLGLAEVRRNQVERGYSMYLDSARVAYEKAVDLDPSSLPAQLGLAWALVRAGDTIQADQILSRIEAEDPESSHTTLVLGIAYAEQGRLDEAFPKFERAVELDASNLEAYAWLGWKHGEEGDFEVSAYWYQQLLVHDPTRVSALLGLGAAYMNLGRYADAEARFREALALEPDSERAQTYLQWALDTRAEQ